MLFCYQIHLVYYLIRRLAQLLHRQQKSTFLCLPHYIPSPPQFLRRLGRPDHLIGSAAWSVNLFNSFIPHLQLTSFGVIRPHLLEFVLEYCLFVEMEIILPGHLFLTNT